MTIIDEFKAIFADLPPEDQLEAAYDAIETGIEEGIIVAVRDPDGEIRYIHKAHYADEPIVPLAEVRLKHQQMLYGDGLN